jgi:hypothetical protein
MATGTQLKKQLPHKINGFGDHFASAKLNPQPRFRQAQLPWFNLVASKQAPQSFGNFCGVIELHRASLSPGGLNPRSAAKTSVEQMNGRPLVNGWLSIAIPTSTMGGADELLRSMDEAGACRRFPVNSETGTILRARTSKRLRQTRLGGFFQSLFCPTICFDWLLNKGFYDL